MSLTLAWSPLLLVLLLAAAGVGAWWAYRRTVPALAVQHRLLLAGLRFVTLALLLFLLAQPVLRSVVETEHPPVVVVLVDDSRSLDLPAPDGAVFAGSVPDAVRAVMPRISSELEGLDVRAFRFGDDVRAIDPSAMADSLTFDRPRTDLSRALDEAHAVEAPAAVVLVSDGRYNTGLNPALRADRYPVPVFTLTVGDTTRHRDVIAARLLTNELAYRNVELPFDVGLRHFGFPGATVQVTLSDGTGVLDRAVLELPSSDGETSVSLQTTPKDPGIVRYTVAVTRLDGERTWSNNEVSVGVRVVDSRRRVLLVASAPSPDLSSIRSHLESDPDLSIEQRTQKAPGEYYEGALPDPATMDLLVLVGFPGREASADDVSRIRGAAQEGTPLLYLLDRTSDLRAAQSLGDALPASPRAIRPGFTETTFVPTAAGRRHPSTLELLESVRDPAARLAPLDASNAEWIVTPDAEVLASPRIRGIDLPDPLLAVRRRGASRSAVVLASGLWRWRIAPESVDEGPAAHAALLDGLLRWLSAPEDDRPVRVRPVSRSFDGSDPVRFVGQVYDDAAQPVSDAVVEVRIALPGGEERSLDLQPLGTGRYSGVVATLEEGSYDYTAVATREGAVLGEDRGSFAVEPLTIEYLDTRADPALMAVVAQRTGGAVLPASADGLRRGLEDRGLLEPRVLTSESTLRLWHIAPLLAALLVLLTLEWFLRKRRGLV